MADKIFKRKPVEETIGAKRANRIPEGYSKVVAPLNIKVKEDIELKDKNGATYLLKEGDELVYTPKV